MLRKIASLILLGLVSFNVYAIPALQLGPGTIGNWSYNAATKTWDVTSDTFSLEALANSDGADANGAYAWDPLGASDQYAYLIIAATPDIGDVGDGFDVSVNNDGSALTMIDFGYGNPPLNDPNSVASHGIYDTYFEIYEFQFDGSPVTIGNTQPGDTGTGEGYSEIFDISVNSLLLGALGLHFDLFTIGDNGQWNPGLSADKQMVNSFAPFSHDAAYVVPVPAAFWLFGTALIGFIGFSRRTSV